MRSVNPGHIIRGGDIQPYDRILSIRFGVKACELIDEGLFGNMVTLKGEEMSYVSLEEVIGQAKVVSRNMLIQMVNLSELPKQWVFLLVMNKFITFFHELLSI